MTDAEEIAIARKLPKGSARALRALTDQYVLPGRDTFNANGAFNLTWVARSYGGLAKCKIIDRRAAYCITPLGERIRDRLP